MSRIVEAIRHFLVWLGRAAGLTKRPLPEPPQIPKPPMDEWQPPTVGPLLFYGPFIPQWGSFDFRELVTFDFRYQVHGCGSTAQRYGIKDPVKNRVRFKLAIKNLETGGYETGFSFDGINATEREIVTDRLYWLPGYSGTTKPPYFMPRRWRPLGCTTTPSPTPLPTPEGSKYRIALKVSAPNGQTWGWEETVTVSGNPCT